VLHLTVAGADDQPLESEGELLRNLGATLRRYGDPQLALPAVYS
jgi:hypothetical protein